MDHFQIRGCKKLGPAVEVSTERATDALHDALCKAAILAFEFPIDFNDHISRAYQFVQWCRANGRPWKLKEIRALEKRTADEADFRAQVQRADGSGPASRCDCSCSTRIGSGPTDPASRPGNFNDEGSEVRDQGSAKSKPRRARR